MGSSTSEIAIAGEKVTITHPTKLLWKEKGIRKIDFLFYLQEISPYQLPFLQDRLLTTIRFPNGIGESYFYQKNCPDYAPAFVETKVSEDIRYIVCNHMATLLWLGNQAAVEYHVPFAPFSDLYPSEIVIDLDPPSRADFSLAIEAALIIKEMFDRLKLQSFVKTSGNKGLQIYLPLPEKTFTYDDTKLFTTFVAQYLVEKEPRWFTTERFKQKRGNKLYVDYLQHGKGKTIIAPYSLRGNQQALVATPLFWDEVKQGLTPDQFPLDVISSRIKHKGCPFQLFFTAKQHQPISAIIDMLKSQT